jgi:hypothetical protein
MLIAWRPSARSPRAPVSRGRPASSRRVPILVAARRWRGDDRLIRVVSGAASFATGLWLAYQVGWIEGLFLASQPLV